MIRKLKLASSPRPKKNRHWTDLELDCFADVLADPENSFAANLDKLALKKSSNNEVYEWRMLLSILAS